MKLAEEKRCGPRYSREKSLDRIPLDIRVTGKTETTVREQMRNGLLQLDAALSSVHESWKLEESSDWIPAMRPDVGCSCLATAYGGEYYWGDNPNQTPGILHPIVTDIERDIPLLGEPDPLADGWIPEGLERIRMFADAGSGDVPVSLLDAAGGVNVAADILGVSELLITFYTHPEALHVLLAGIQRLFIATIEAGIDAAGGEQYITTTDFPDFWFPPGFKGHVSDDISASFGPDIYREFSAPYHSMIFDRFGAGGLHNCGPNPCHSAYSDHPGSPVSIDLSDAFSHDDLANFKSSLNGRGFIYLTFDTLLDNDREPVSWYREIMELCAPELIVVPVIYVSNTDDGKALYRNLEPLAIEYAKRMNWGWFARSSPAVSESTDSE